ncbi:tyrosine 2,3-aminomutase [Amycolatopsis decaplanina]|uniref:Histidine ammonia-lyase n=1 Tax=Amycolatopsis decaplanina DSM 44594 TaxID=1284240 RepID=M2YW01_9PSEU|nr:tyrosine 2,3-aminomutase [Amycolatopsis decaplanina]EME52529.1 histidine ammonia-lyase [Amycolatopsis decaplanina DSM 44594]
MTTRGHRPVELDGEGLDLAGVRRIAEYRAPCTVAPSALADVESNRKSFEELVGRGVPVYGVTTGYGELVHHPVGAGDEVALQTNLVRSHSAGVGPLFAEDEVRAMIAARLNALAKGYSAVRPAVLDRLAAYLNLNITPAVPEMGSLGASGDLAPLSHVAVTLIGEGYVLEDGERTPTGPVLERHGIVPLTLRAKEGLALINGTSAMTGLGALVVGRALDQVRQAEIISALVVEVLRGSTSPFLAAGHERARPHRGQIDTAANLRVLLDGSGLAVGHAELSRQARDGDGEVYLQKAYTLRAVPQVLGAVRDTLRQAEATLEIELNSANDNPLFFGEPGEEEIFHGANFHGQPIAFAMDHCTIALTQLGVFSERRTHRLLNRHLNDGLPEFLIANDPGLHSGLAGAQYPASALVAENRTIGPASTQSVPANADNQDVVSMGLIGARNARRVLANNNWILAVELLAAAQAVDVSGRYTRLGPLGRITHDQVRATVPALDRDRYLSDDIGALAAAIARGDFLDAVVRHGAELR